MNEESDKWKSLAGELAETLRWMAQTFHQAHHHDQRGTFDKCPKNTCDAATQSLTKAHEAGL